MAAVGGGVLSQHKVGASILPPAGRRSTSHTHRAEIAALIGAQTESGRV